MPKLNVSFRDALKGVRLPTGDKVTLVVAPPPGEVLIRFDIDPKEAGGDDRFVLATGDGKYKQERTLKDDQVAGDKFVDLRFTELKKNGRYTLEHDPGKDGTKEKVFEDIPYADLVGLSRDAKGDPAQAETGAGELRVRLDIDPNDAKSRDDKFTLKSTDGSFTQTKTVKDDQTPGDAFVDLLFTGVPTTKDFALEVDLGKEGKPELVFDQVPYGELAGMCWQHAPDDEETGETDGKVKIRLEIDPNEALSRDDKFTLSSSDGSYKVTKTTKDDLKPGDGFTDLLFTQMPKHLDYALDVDLGKEGGSQRVFENVPYSELAQMSWQLAPADPDAEPEPDKGDLLVRLEIDPNEASSRDDKFTLFSTDKSFRQVKTVKDDKKAGDKMVDLLFTGLPKALTYALEVDLGKEGGPMLVFNDVPYAELAALSWQLAPLDLDDDPPSGQGDLRIRLDIDPDDADIHDDKITLRATDGSFSQTRTVRDDQRPGDEWLDVVFTKLPTDRDFTLEIDEGDGRVEKVFENVPYAELAGLSWNVAQGPTE